MSAGKGGDSILVENLSQGGVGMEREKVYLTRLGIERIVKDQISVSHVPARRNRLPPVTTTILPHPESLASLNVGFARRPITCIKIKIVAGRCIIIDINTVIETGRKTQDRA